MSREVWFLRQVEKQQYSNDFVQNISQLNNTMASVSKYLISMQQGIDDLDRDIFEVIGDFIEEVIILFGGGDTGDTGFQWGDLKYIFQAIGRLFGLNSGTGSQRASADVMAGNLFSEFLSPLDDFQDAISSVVDGAVGGILGGFSDIVSAIFGIVNNDYVSDLDVINDHSRTIGEMRAELDQLTIHGMARVLTGDGFFYATPGTVRADLVMIAAGGAGGTGAWNLISGSRSGGSGGGGGGENHFVIHGSALFDPVTGMPRAIPYSCGAPSTGGAGNESSGQGGGNTTFDEIVVYGGQGGRYHGGAGVGGYGIVNGGSAAPDADPALRDSLSAAGLYGGGGAGGRGATGAGASQPGGRGGLNPGGAGVTSGHGLNAPPVSRSAPTGGGGGGGGALHGRGGDGAFPGGGGGGSGGASAVGNIQPGGNGAPGVIYVIERAF